MSSVERRGTRRGALLLAPLALLLLLRVAESGAAPSPSLILDGRGTGVDFGISVAGSEDVNGDGFEDFIVGELGYPRPGLGSGRAYLFFGGPAGDSLPDLTLLPEGPLDGFGDRVAAPGDLNGDGFADLAVSAPRYDFRQVSTLHGRVYVYFGGNPPDATADLKLTGQEILIETFGYRLAPAGDMNGDGFSDLAVGTLYFGEGRVDVFFGGSAMDTIPDFHPASGGGVEVGPVVSWARDVNGDGFDDLIVIGNNATGEMRAVIYYGGPQPDLVPDITIIGPSGEGWGYAAWTAGDFNADGFADVVVSALGNDAAGTEAGRVYVYYGGPAADSVPDLILPGAAPHDRFGASLCSADVNGDGVSDLIVGAPHPPLNVSDSEAGRVFVFFGGAHPDTIPDVVLEGEAPQSDFGFSVSAGDMSGDGVPEVIVGAPAYGCTIAAPCLPPSGRVYVFDLAAPLPARAFLRDGHRTIPLVETPPQICVRFEPVGSSYDNPDVDLATVRLVSAGTGETGEIEALTSKAVAVGDTDGNGVVELSAYFSRSDLTRLFSAVRGRRMVEVALEGRLTTRRRFRAPLQFTVVGAPEAGREVVAKISPNPLNPQGVLRFTTGAPGPVTLRLVDVAGRLVRTIVQRERFGAGEHSLVIDGRDDRGQALATGVYFYRLETVEGEVEGRFTVLK